MLLAQSEMLSARQTGLCWPIVKGATAVAAVRTRLTTFFLLRRPSALRGIFPLVIFFFVQDSKARGVSKEAFGAGPSPTCAKQNPNIGEREREDVTTAAHAPCRRREPGGLRLGYASGR